MLSYTYMSPGRRHHYGLVARQGPFTSPEHLLSLFTDFFSLTLNAPMCVFGKKDFLETLDYEFNHLQLGVVTQFPTRLF